MARGRVRPASRTSPEILLTSHHPPKEKNAPTIAAPKARSNGSEPGLCATKGRKFDHEPRRSEKPHTTSTARSPSFSHVLQRSTPALTRMLSMFKVQSSQMTATATNFMAIEDRGRI